MLLSRFLLVLGLVWASFAQAQAPSLTLDTVQAAAGQSVGVPLRAQGLGSAIAVQVDIGYDPQVLTPQAPAPGTALNGHSVDWRIVGEGTLRLVVYTDACVAIGDGSLVVLPFDVAASAAGRSPLTFAAALATDGQGAALDSLTLIDGAVVIEPSAPPTPIPAISTFGMLLLALALVLVAHRARYGRFYLLAAVLVASGLPDQPLYAQDQGAVADIVDTILGRSDAGQDCNGDNVVDVRDLACLTCAAPPPDNQPPRITSTPVTAATSGVAYSYQVIAEHPDQGDSQTYSLPVAPAGMSIGEDSGLITWTPTTAGQVNVQVQVTDSGGLSATQDYQITVTEENAPQLLPVGDRTIPAGDAFTTRLFAIDPDPGDTLSFSLTTAPNGMGIDPSTGDLSWTPPAATEETVTARVTDSTDRSDTQSFTVTVTEPFSPGSTNSPPTLAPIADQTLTEGDTLSLTAEGSDPDAGDTVTYSLAAAPDGMTIDPSTGAISWTATPPGAYDVTALVEDQGGFVAAQAFIVTVEAVNAAPTANDDVYIARKGETLTVPAPEGVLQNDTDPNDDPLSATRLSDPTKGTIDSFNADGSFNYTPGEPPGITIGVVQKCRSDLGTNVEAGTLAAADVDQDGAVELVGFVPRGLSTNVIIVDPSDCSYEQFAIDDDLGQPEFATVPTLVNLDDDPELEVVSQYFRFNPAIPTFGNGDERLFATNLDGTVLDAWVATNGDNGLSGANSFDTGLNGANLLSGPVAVDLDGDGDTELVVGITNAAIGNGVAGVTSHAVVAYDGHTGAVLWEFIGDFTSLISRSETPNIVDLDLDGDAEIIWSHHVLDHEGNLVFNLPVDLQFGGVRFFLSTAIANFDNDPFPEILGIDRLNIRLFSHDGQVQWEIPWDSTRSAGFPWSDITIAELDGDPFPEFVVMLTPDADFGITLYAFDSDGQELWNHGPQSLDLVVAQFGQTLSSSPVAIDLDRDGIDELIQVRGTTTNGVDDAGLYIFDGETGAILDFHQGQTQNDNDETLTVADIDGDGSAEIVTNINTEFGFDPIEIWDHLPGNPFPPAPRIRSGTRFQTSWVNEDGSIPTSLPPFWLQPGQNGWNRLAPPLDPLNPESDSFTYRVSDGEFDSNTATVNIEIRPNGNPPFFLSEPKRGTSAGIRYSYQPLVIDVDPGDSVTFELLNGPAGMAIDPVTGALDWYPESNGDYPVSIAATDKLGLSSAQIFTLTVGDPVEVPDLIGLSEADAGTALTGAGLALGSRFFRSDAVVPAGEVVAQNPPAGSVAEFGASVRVTLSSGPTQADTDGDGDDFTPNEGDCDDGNDTIYPGATEIDGDGIDQSCNGIDGNKTLVAIEVTPTGRRLLTGEPQPLRAIGVFEDGTAQDLTGVASWTLGPTFSSATPGNFTAEASFEGVTGSADFAVVDRVDEDAAPLVRIDDPAEDAVLTGPTEVRGVARDPNFLRYELAVAPADSETFTQIAESTAQLSGGVLGTFDATRLENDQYRLRLRAWDRGGNVSEDTVVVQVDGYRKVGNFDLAFEDLVVPVPGLPLRIVRSYSTDNKRGKDFGIGWRLGIDSLRLTRNRPIGTAWRVARSGLTFALVEEDLHKVTVTLPDGRVESFDAVVSPSASPIVPFPALSQTVNYAPRPGTYGSLEALGDNTVTILDAQPGPATLTVGVTGEIYDPERYRYTAVNGTEVVIHRVNGVESIRDRNGNVLTISEDGIAHSAGRSIEFERDAQGRITAIVDPAGNRQSYRYDSNGDLVTHIDALGQRSRFEYDASHNLLRIFDPAGRNILENRYDAAGRIVSTTDSEGRQLTFVRDPDANEERVIDDDGAETLYEYDDRGNVTRKVDALGNETLYAYDANDNLVSETNALGETTTRSFDDDGNLLSVTDPLGNTTTFVVDSFGNVTSETDPAGNSTTFRYDAGGNLVEAVAPDGSVRAYAHSDEGQVVSVTDETGAVQAFKYNARGDQTVRTDARGGATVAQFDAAGRLTGLTDRRGHATAVSVNARGSRTETVDPLGNREAYGYSLTGRLETVTDADGNEQRQVTDALGRVLSLTDRSGGELRFGFDLRGNLASRTDPRGAELRHEYDAIGQRVRTVHPDGSEERFAYDDAGRLVEGTDRRGFVTRFEYDAAGRQTAIINALGARTDFVYDARGNVIEEVDAAGNTTRHTYDSRNRRTATELPDGRTFSYSYTARGELASETDPQGNTASYAYDANGNLVQVKDAIGAETVYRYDAEDNLVEQIDARGNATRYEYDANNREIRRIYPDGSVEATEYDAVGNVSARVRADGTRIEFSYDGEGRLVARSHPGGLASYTRDAAGALLSAANAELTTTYSRDSEGRVTRLELDDGRRIDYGYDAAGNIVERTVLPLAGEAPRTTRHGYDGLGRLVLTRDPDGSETTYSWTPTDEIATIGYGNGITTMFTYDVTRRLTELAFSDGTGPIERLRYSYDAADNIIAIEALDGSRIDYEYDAVRRLLRETHRDAGGTITRDFAYGYDAVGNRTRLSDRGTVTAYSYDSADKLLTRGSELRGYDPRGNLAALRSAGSETGYRYDALDRLVAVDTPTASVRYGYDAEDRRVRRTVDGSVVDYLVEPGSLNASGVAQVLAESNPAAGSVLAENIYDFRLLARLAGGERRYLHRDASENVRLLTDDSGAITDRYAYDAFGARVEVSGASDNPYRFASERMDPVAGIIHLRARDYEPLAGRFLGRDPFPGLFDQPHSRHRYYYARNNPLSFFDPTGRFTLANLSASVSLGEIIIEFAPQVTTGITTIILLNKFWKPGFELREAGYLVMVGDPRARDLLPGDVVGALEDYGYAAFLAGNRLIEVGALAIDAADKLSSAGFALLGAAQSLGGALKSAPRSATRGQNASTAIDLGLNLTDLVEKGKSLGGSLEALAKAVDGKSRGPDKETLKSRGQLEAERTKKLTGEVAKSALKIFGKGF